MIGILCDEYMIQDGVAVETNMLNIVNNISSNIKFRIKPYNIDNIGFKFHYRFTVLLLFAFVIIACSQELIGEHIRCISDQGVPSNVIDTFCFFTSTFTVVKYLDEDLLDTKAVAHPGVGAMGIDSDEKIIRHAYYQWVPFVIFAQGLCFYVTHGIWKRQEGGRLRKLIEGLEYAAFATDKRIQVRDKEVPSIEEIDIKFRQLKIIFHDHLVINRTWTFWLIFCEILNFLNVLLQIWWTNKFLGGLFLSLGPKLLTEGLNSNVDVLDVVFPKITKCTFHKYGPSGTIQSHDAMCVMSSNIINEKVFAFLWFWYLLLFVVSAISLLWRAVSGLLHARSVRFNKWVFSMGCPGKLNPWNVLTVTKNCCYTDWLFLVYLMENMDALVFRKFMTDLARELDANQLFTNEMIPLSDDIKID